MVKKQSFQSITIKAQSKGIAVGEGKPGSKAPIGYIVLLMSLKSCNGLHFPDFLGIVKIRSIPWAVSFLNIVLLVIAELLVNS